MNSEVHLLDHPENKYSETKALLVEEFLVVLVAAELDCLPKTYHLFLTFFKQIVEILTELQVHL